MQGGGSDDGQRAEQAHAGAATADTQQGGYLDSGDVPFPMLGVRISHVPMSCGTVHHIMATQVLDVSHAGRQLLLRVTTLAQCLHDCLLSDVWETCLSQCRPVATVTSSCMGKMQLRV